MYVGGQKGVAGHKSYFVCSARVMRLSHIRRHPPSLISCVGICAVVMEEDFGGICARDIR